MKKRLPILLMIFALLVIAAICIIWFTSRSTTPDMTPAPSGSEQDLETPDVVTGYLDPGIEPTEAQMRPLQSLIFINDKLYSLVEITPRPFFDQTEYALYGVLEKSVSRYEEPTDELTTNDEVLVGCEVHEHISEKYVEALAVYVDDADWIYAPYEPVPEEEKTYSFESGENLAALAVSSMEKMGYTQIGSDKYELFEFTAIPEDCNNFIGVFEQIMEAPGRYRVVQLWYGTDPYRLLVLSQEHVEVFSPLPYGNLSYIDRTRLPLSPEYAWVISQAHFTGESGYYYLVADLFLSDDISDGYGDFIADVVG